MRTAVVLTGASRGFGRAIATQLARSQPMLDLVFIGRHVAEMQGTAELVRAANPDANVWVKRGDLSDVEAVDRDAASWFADLAQREYGRYICVHNSGSILLNSAEHISSGDAQAHIALGVTSLFTLNKHFVALAARVPTPSKPHLVVDVSSLAGVQPFPSWSVYCVVKAARQMLGRVLATEHDPGFLKTLAFGPGAMETDMQRAIRNSSTVHPEVRKALVGLYEQGKLVPVDTSAHHLCRLIDAPEFESGAYVDINDVLSKL